MKYTKEFEAYWRNAWGHPLYGDHRVNETVKTIAFRAWKAGKRKGRRG